MRGSRWMRAAGHAGALLGYALLGLALTWPLARHWDSGFMGFARSFQDGIQNVWNMWWMRWALGHGQSPFWNPQLYYPDGLQMYLQAISAPLAFLTLPVTYLAGPTAAYNTATIACAALTGYGVFLLAQAFVPGRLVAWICGALVVASPFLMTRLLTNQLNLTCMQWLPFYFLALLRLEQRASWGRLLWATALVLLLLLTDWYWTMVCVAYTVAWVASGLLRGPGRGRLLRRYLALTAAVLLVTAPLFIAIASVRNQLPIGGGQPDSTWELYIRGFSLDALGLFYPAVYQPLWADGAARFIDAARPGPFSFEGSYTAAGWVLLGLAALGVWHYGRTYWRLLFAAAAGYILSLGPTLHVLGRDTGVPMPYALIEQLPLIGTARRPNLYAVPAIVVAAIFAALALHHLLRALTARRRAGLILAVSALAAVELWPPATRDLYIVSASPLVAGLRARPGAVADLPYERQESSRSLLNQIAHEQPILGGYVSRRPPYDALRYLPNLAQISAMQLWPGPDIVDTAASLAAAQCAYPLRHVLVSRAAVTPLQLTQLEAVLRELVGGPVTPAGEDSDYRWYELPPAEHPCAPFLYLGRGWQQLERDATRRWRWIGASGDIWLVNPFARPITLTLTFSAEAFGPPGARRMITFMSDGTRIGPFPVERQQRSCRLSVVLPPGLHLSRLLAETSIDAQTGRELGISVGQIRLAGFMSLP